MEQSVKHIIYLISSISFPRKREAVLGHIGPFGLRPALDVRRD
jgi:hypothetical protein